MGTLWCSLISRLEVWKLDGSRWNCSLIFVPKQQKISDNSVQVSETVEVYYAWIDMMCGLIPGLIMSFYIIVPFL